MHAVGQKRGSQRVAFDACVGNAVEGKARGPGMLQPAGIGNAEIGAHFETPGSFDGFFSPAL